MLTGAGSAELNGVYLRQKTGAKRNGARVYEKGEYMLSREVIGGGAGFIVGKAPRAFYAYQTEDTVAPESGWSVQEHGVAPPRHDDLSHQDCVAEPVGRPRPGSALEGDQRQVAAR